MMMPLSGNATALNNGSVLIGENSVNHSSLVALNQSLG